MDPVSIFLCTLPKSLIAQNKPNFYKLLFIEIDFSHIFNASISLFILSPNGEKFQGNRESTPGAQLNYGTP